MEDRIKEYRGAITYSDNVYQKLGIDELLGLLAECINYEQITSVVNKYIGDYNGAFASLNRQSLFANNILNLVHDYEDTDLLKEGKE